MFIYLLTTLSVQTKCSVTGSGRELTVGFADSQSWQLIQTKMFSDMAGPGIDRGVCRQLVLAAVSNSRGLRTVHFSSEVGYSVVI